MSAIVHLSNTLSAHPIDHHQTQAFDIPGVYSVSSQCTFLFPPVIVTFTNRRVYVILFFARPLGVFFFSWGSTCITCHH